MAVILFLGAPIFLTVIFLSTTFYYRSKVIRCEKRLQRMWVQNMLRNESPTQRIGGIHLFYDGKDDQFKAPKTAEEDTNKVESP